MATKISTGLAAYLLGVGSLRQAMAGSFLRIYTGTEPATADSALDGSNTLLAEFSVDGTGTGLTLESVADGALITKNTGELWKATALATGVATFFRWVAPGDSGENSTARLRVQGRVAVAGAELNFSSVNFTQGAEQKVDYFAIAMPSG